MDICETSTQLGLHLEDINNQLIQIKDHSILVNDCLRNALDGRSAGWSVTVNTKAIINDMYDSRKLEDEVSKLEGQIKVMSKNINYFCYRRRLDKKLKVLAGFEVGNETHRLHAHLVLVHSGDVDKTLNWMRREVFKEWQRFYDFDGSGFVDVQAITDARGAVAYATKNTSNLLRKYHFGNVQLF